MLQGSCVMKRLCKLKRLNRLLLSGSSFWLLHTATRLLHHVFNLHHPAWVHIVIWYVIIDMFLSMYSTSDTILNHAYIIYFFIWIYMHMYYCVVYALNLWYILDDCWPDDGPSFIHRSVLNGPTFQVTSLGAQSRPWPRRSRDRRRSKRPRISKTVKAPRLPVIEQLGTEIYPGGQDLTPRKVTNMDEKTPKINR